MATDAIVEELSAHDPELVRAVCTKFEDADDFGSTLSSSRAVTTVWKPRAIWDKNSSRPVVSCPGDENTSLRGVDPRPRQGTRHPTDAALDPT